MVKRISVVCLAAVSIVLMTGMLTYAMEMKGKIGFAGYGGYSMLSPAAFNEHLVETKDTYEDLWWGFGPNSGAVKELKGAIRYGGEIRYGLTSNLTVGAGYSRMSGSGQVNWDGGFGWTGEWKATLAVTGYTASVFYVYPMGRESSNLYVGGGAGWYSGKITRTSSDSNNWIGWWDKVVYQGISTLGFHGIAGFEYFLSDNIAFAVEGMYSSVIFPSEWTIIESPDAWRIGDISVEWDEPIQAGGITIGAGMRFYVG